MPRENTTGISEEIAQSSLLESEGTWSTYEREHVTVSFTSEASPLRILYPGVCNGLKPLHPQYAIYLKTSFWPLHGQKKKKKSELSFHSEEETSNRGVSSDRGEMFTFFSFRNNVFWPFHLIFKTGSSGAPLFTHVLYDVLCEPGVPPYQWTHFTWYMLVSSSEPVWAPAAGTGHSWLLLPIQ